MPDTGYQQFLNQFILGILEHFRQFRHFYGHPLREFVALIGLIELIGFIGFKHNILFQNKSSTTIPESGILNTYWTKIMKPNDNNIVFVLCIENKDCDDLEKRKVYQVLPDDKATDEGYLRIIDESGEDYLYPESYFIPVELPREVQDALRIPR